MVNIYVLKLEENKYYVGKTYKTVEERFKEHFGKQGSAWTRRYKPLEVVESYENGDEFDEDKLTKIYMAKYGIDNVRGAAYCRINIDCATMKLLKREIWNALNKCMECGSEYHYISQCDIYAHSIINKNSSSEYYMFLLTFLIIVSIALLISLYFGFFLFRNTIL